MILKYLRIIWEEIQTPERFIGDPYGGMTNQAGHILLGIFTTGAFFLFWSAIFEEMPYRSLVAVGSCLSYFYFVENFQQKHIGIDAIVDTYFWSLGVFLISFSFYEVPLEGTFTLELQKLTSFFLILLSLFSVFMYGVSRIKVSEK